MKRTDSLITAVVQNLHPDLIPQILERFVRKTLTDTAKRHNYSKESVEYAVLHKVVSLAPGIRDTIEDTFKRTFSTHVARPPANNLDEFVANYARQDNDHDRI